MDNCLHCPLRYLFYSAFGRRRKIYFSEVWNAVIHLPLSVKGLWVIHPLSLQPQVTQLAGSWNGWRLMPHHWDCASSSPVGDGWINRRTMEPLRELSSLQNYRQQSTSHVSKMPFPQDTRITTEDKISLAHAIV